MESWQLINSAPKDGSSLLLAWIDRLGESRVSIGKFEPGYGYWHYCQQISSSKPPQPTHWQPIPAPPVK